MKIKPATFIPVLFIILGLFIGFVLITMTTRSNKVPSLGSFMVTGTYAINPENLLASLNNGNLDVFLPVLKTPEEPLFAEPVKWRQEDYLKVTNALSLFVWNESLEDWKIYSMRFQTSCQESQKGFNWAEFYFYKEISTGWEKYYSVRGMFINPEYGYVIGGGDTYSRPIFGWKYIDINDVMVTPEEALIMAEEKGGKEVRLSVNNECHIFIEMYPEINNYYDWDVRYEGNIAFLYSDLRSRSRFRIKSK